MPKLEINHFTVLLFLAFVLPIAFRILDPQLKPKPHPDCSVADPGCLSRIPDPDFYPSRIPDPKTAKKREVKKISCHNFLCSHKFHKIVNYFSFEVLKKKIWANFQRIIELLTKKNCQKALKNMILGSGIRGPGSGTGKNLFRIPDPGVKKAPDPGSGSATLPDCIPSSVSFLLYSSQKIDYRLQT